MFIQSLFKNNNYLISNRNYLFDYSKIPSKQIDMTLSGRYLSDYKNLNINIGKWDQYPSYTDIQQLEKEIQKCEKTDQEIILGAGANGILQNLVKIFFAKKGNLVTPFYTFDQVEFAVTSFGCVTRRVYLDHFKIDFSKMKKSINRKTRMVYICNPNNPTGVYENHDDILNFIRSVNVPVIVDESGIEFTNEKSLLNCVDFPDNLFIVRSFSKAYGLANLRLGYLVCNSSFKQKYMQNVTTNEFSGLACIVAMEILKNEKKCVEENIKNVIKARKLMIEKLNQLGIQCVPSKSNIIMTASIFNERFLKLLEMHNISVVPVYDEEGRLHIRIAIQDLVTNKKFIDILTKIMKSKNIDKY